MASKGGILLNLTSMRLSTKRGSAPFEKGALVYVFANAPNMTRDADRVTARQLLAAFVENVGKSFFFL